jgi:NADH-ubiquinone oxidoreductase chain 4
MILASPEAKTKKFSLFLTTLVTLTLTLILAFRASQLRIFYIFFEASLLPTLFLIIIWGYQPERLQARTYLILYTVGARLPLLIRILLIHKTNAHLRLTLPLWITPNLFPSSIWWWITIAAFAAKTPIYSLHLWLPKAHVEAPIAGSMVLAGILLKLGGFGLLRLAPLFQHINKSLSLPLISLALWGRFISALICLRQADLKALIAYRSVTHIGPLFAGIMSNTTWGWQAALTIMIAHGLASSALFALANISYQATHTRRIFLTKGTITLAPQLAFLWFLTIGANIAIPPSINLQGEIILLTATMSISRWLLIPLRLGVFFSAVYSLHMFTAINQGAPSRTSNPFTSPTPRDAIMILLHLIPAFTLLLKTELFTCWT